MRNTLTHSVQLLIFAFGACVLGSCVPSQEDGVVVDAPVEVVRPNIVLISLDTTRADHLSAYGYGRRTTPYLEKFAAEGVLFEQAYAPMGITGPSHATLFTGLYPIAHGVVKNGLKLSEEHETLAEILSGAGYQTAGFVSSFVLDRKFGLDQGFGVYDDDIQPEEGNTDLKEWEGFTLEKGFDRRGQHTLERGLGWLVNARKPDAPFFMFLHFFDPHAPYLAMEQFVDELDPDWRTRDVLGQAKALYDAEIRYVDVLIQSLIEQLQALELDEDTLVVVTADHGEGLMDHGYMMHGLGIYEEEVRVPLLMRWPGGLAVGKRISGPVVLNDVLPTVLSLAGIEYDKALSGIDLRGAIEGTKGVSEGERSIFFHRRYFDDVYAEAGHPGMFSAGEKPDSIHLEGHQFGVRRGVWKYSYTPESGAVELYHLGNDPGELVDLSDGEPGIAASLRAEVEGWVLEEQREVEDDAVLLESDREALEALGYLE